MNHSALKANILLRLELLLSLCVLLGFGAEAGRAANLTFTVGNTNGSYDAQVVVPIRVSQFTNINGFQFSLHWNSNVATFIGVEQFGLQGMGFGNFNTNIARTGTLTLAWDDPSGGATNLTSGAMIFGVRFRISGPVASSSQVTIDGTPAAFEAMNGNFIVVPVSAVSGTITVSAGNTNAPVLTAIGNQSVDEGNLLSFTVTASDPDEPVQGLIYSLTNAPAGASVHPTSGLFTWTPGEMQGPGVYLVTVRVTDNGVPVLNDSETISITVNEVNSAPVLTAIGSKFAIQGSPLTFTASANDPDIPAQSLNYSLSNAPAGATIHPSSGAFDWTPAATQGAGNYTVTVWVTDNGNPALSDLESISISVSVVPVQIITQPASQIVTNGQMMALNVAVTGSVPRYQWRKDGTNILGATNASLPFPPVQMSDGGLYSVTVSNDLGVVVSSNALLVVTAFGAPVTRADGEVVVETVTRTAATTLTLATAFSQGYIFYTLDGSAPTFSSPLYSGPITVSNTVVVRALALSSDFSQQAEAPAATVFVLLYSVQVTSGGGGVATVFPAQSYYTSNSLVTLTATPSGGWNFLRWEGDASGSSNPLALNVQRSLQVQAVFGTSLFTNVLGSGQIEITPGGPVPYGSTVELRAVPNPGQKFVAWGNAVSGTNNPRLFTITQPGPTVAALFAAGPAGFPVITNQPSNRVVSAGGSFTLSVGASGTGPMQYQWRRNGAVIEGATNATLEISHTSPAQAGRYDVVVSGPEGTVVSAAASVLVTAFDVRPVVSLLGVPGTGFRVEFTDDFDGGPWLRLTNGVLSAERQEVIDFTSTNRARRFYRTVVEP